MRRGNHRKFGRETIQRKALQKALVTSLIEHGRIKTTLAKAKTLRGISEKLVTFARKGDMASRREVAKILSPKTVVKLFTEIAPKYVGRNGGYTRVTKAGQRKSDGAEVAYIEFIQ